MIYTNILFLVFEGLKLAGKDHCLPQTWYPLKRSVGLLSEWLRQKLQLPYMTPSKKEWPRIMHTLIHTASLCLHLVSWVHWHLARQVKIPPWNVWNLRISMATAKCMEKTRKTTTTMYLLRLNWQSCTFPTTLPSFQHLTSPWTWVPSSVYWDALSQHLSSTPQILCSLFRWQQMMSETTAGTSGHILILVSGLKISSMIVFQSLRTWWKVLVCPVLKKRAH